MIKGFGVRPVLKRNKDDDRNGYKGKLLPELHPKEPAAEAYRLLRSNLRYMSVDNPPRSFLVTSAMPGEGKSLTAANLAISMALVGSKTLLLDGDLRIPSVHEVFGVDNRFGFTTKVLEGGSWANIVTKVEIENLDICTSGPLPPNPAELLGARRTHNALREASADYEQVIIDGPPVLGVSESLSLAKMVDGVILVVRAKKTSHIAAVEAKERLEQVGARILGVVLGDTDIKNSVYYGY